MEQVITSEKNVLPANSFYIYLAGFFDGEGSIYTRSYHRKTGDKRQNYPYTQCCFIMDMTNCNLELLEYIQNTLKLGGIYKATPSKHQLKSCYHLRFNMAEQLLLLPKIIDYLIDKKKLAQERLEVIQSRKNKLRKLRPRCMRNDLKR